MSPELLTFNGIDGVSGTYIVPPMRAEDLAALAQGHALDPVHLSELLAKYRETDEGHYGPAEGIDPKNLADAGWGVIFAYNADPEIHEALSELLTHRKRQATQNKEAYYKEFVGPDAYRPGESKVEFLTRHGVGPGPANPEKMPYYLLIVGDPDTIPYRFQYQLDVQYGVGRIHFDTIEEYSNYARSVVAAETRPDSQPRRAVFFGVNNPDDRATAMSSEKLTRPLCRSSER